MPLSERVYCAGITFKMTERVEQQICIKVCVKLEHSSSETIWRIRRLLGMTQWVATQIKVWHRCFKDGWESVESDPHSGRPAPSRTPENVARVQVAINKDWWLTVEELEADLGIPKLLFLRFWCRILAWNMSWHKSFHGFCHQSRRNNVLLL